MSVTFVNTGGQTFEVTGTGVVTVNVWALARIRWVSATASGGDECEINDAAGNTIFQSFATGADWSDEVEMGKVPPTKGITIDTLSSGSVFFYLR